MNNKNLPGAKILSMSANFLIAIFVLLANLWIWKIFSLSLILGLLTLLSAGLLYMAVNNRSNRKIATRFVITFVLLIFFQWRTTQPTSLTLLDNDQQRIQQMRLNEYPPISIDLSGKKIWIPIAHWFEGRKETIAIFRIQKNFSEAVDPMLYFSANHPRERVGITEFEKFPYILFPFFVIGLYTLSKKMNDKNLLLSIFTPLVLIAIMGSKNPFGPFALFPFLSVVISSGLIFAYQKIKSFKKEKVVRILITASLIYILIFLQVISYARY